jgi:hypothetical protein
VSPEISRRRLFLTSVTAAAATVLATDGPAAASPGHAGSASTRHPELPEVPGMLGDRWANEFWYQFDDTMFFNRSQELDDAYTAIIEYLGGDLERPFREKWLELSKLPEYPQNFISFVTPLRQQLTVLSRAQLRVFDAFYQRRDPRLVAAFSDFGQGVLFDPRRADIASEVHTMDYPEAYHLWHVYLRAMMFLGIDRRRWAEIAPLNGFSWAVFAVAKPNQHVVSPPLPRQTVIRLALQWLPRSADRLDRDFQSVPYPRGIG